MASVRGFLSKTGKVILFLLLPLIVFAWTSAAPLAPYTLHVGLVAFLAAVGLVFWKRGADIPLVKSVLQVLVILLLVGATNWFFSPFFFLLYLVPLYLGFVYTPAVAFGFLAALLVIFSASVGEVDIAYDIMTLLSLLLVIPLVIYLRKKYLVIRQSKRDILILEEEGGVRDMDTISRLLANRITHLGVTIRQPLTFLKQGSTLLLQEKLNPEEAKKYLQRMRTTATEALEHVKQFESTTSANVVLTNKRGITKPNSLQ